MNTIFMVLATVVVASQAATFNMPMLREWAQFKVNYNKQYEHDLEEDYRMKIFFDHKRFIEQHNAAFEKGLTTFTVGVNQFADWTLEEFKRSMLNFNNSGAAVQNLNKVAIKPGKPLDDNVDWRDKGAVTGVKDQGQCGSCWAFSAISSLESAHFLSTKKLISLSEQQLVDCSGAYGNYGCGGGLMTNAFDYIEAVGGIETEDDYAYTARDGNCQEDKSKFAATVASYNNVQSGSEDQLKQFVGQDGPTSVAIDAGHISFQLYNGGIYFEPECSPQALDHGVTAVGYGSTSDGDYWLVKNSWGTGWGEKGYIRMTRNKDNNCGISTMATIPVV